MEYKTIAGNYYTITSKTGCTVTDTTGTLSMTVDAGGQLTVQAPSDKLVYDDEQAIVFKANFKPALAALGLLGGGDELPAGYTRVEFLESTGTQWITSPTPGSNERGARARFSHSSTQTSLGWAFCAFAGDSYVSEIFGALRATIGSVSPLIYGWRGLAKLDMGEEVIKADTIYEVSLNFKNDMKIKMQTPTAVYEDNLASPANQTAEPVHIAGIANIPQKLKGRIYLYEETKGAEIVHSMSPALDPTGTPCMYDRVTGTAYKRGGSGQFVAGVGSVAQLSTLLRNLPPTGGDLTLSLPAEANTPEVADMLQACHDTKGWTLTVHEYRPAAVATYSLRRMREVIWCRKEQSEYGCYVAADGTRWQVERCAAIFGEHGNAPSAYGYEPVDSVEQAAEEWGLVPYVDPEAEELSTIE
ncbi:hypothetical protein [Fibrobacter sp.]|uniref:hypothetical protein n=1 Tax=Fibrobacter sp. TaxID=35828 RepID=UPI0025BF6F31|nr:hypothetical protein [Fibrobacter sp.]MBR4007845.1 hypothetical protein [Fibrobacter sp.]